jgi:ribosomal protein S18 acetylase RimI-like enzyme
MVCIRRASINDLQKI